MRCLLFIACCCFLVPVFVDRCVLGSFSFSFFSLFFSWSLFVVCCLGLRAWPFVFFVLFVSAVVRGSLFVVGRVSSCVVRCMLCVGVLCVVLLFVCCRILFVVSCLLCVV